MNEKLERALRGYRMSVFRFSGASESLEMSRQKYEKEKERQREAYSNLLRAREHLSAITNASRLSCYFYVVNDDDIIGECDE